MNIKAIVFSIPFALSAGAAFGGDSAPSALEPAPIAMTKKIAVTDSTPLVYTMAQINATKPMLIDGAAIFRIRQVAGWCVQSAECNAKLRAALAEDEGPWVPLKADMLKWMAADSQVAWTK